MSNYKLKPADYYSVYGGSKDGIHCRRCNEVLDPKQIVYLEFDNSCGDWVKPGTLREGEGGGLDPFGKTCAKAALTE